MLRVFPQLAGVRLDYVWGGYVDITMNRAPDFGRIGGNLYYLQGFSGPRHRDGGHGGPARRGGDRRARRSASTSSGDCTHRSPGGRWLRTPALVLGMLWFRLRDLL
jgi:gamma-glutamylputrescine oxidase